jgi:hypothetical protein
VPRSAANVGGRSFYVSRSWRMLPSLLIATFRSQVRLSSKRYIVVVDNFPRGTDDCRNAIFLTGSLPDVNDYHRH